MLPRTVVGKEVVKKRNQMLEPVSVILDTMEPIVHVMKIHVAAMVFVRRKAFASVTQDSLELTVPVRSILHSGMDRRSLF